MNESTLTHLTSTDSEKMCMCVRLCMACVCVCVWRFLIVSSLPPSVTLLLPPSLTLSPSLSLSLALAPSVKSPCRDAQNHSCHWACSMQAQLSHRGAHAASTCPLLLPWQAPQNWRSPPCQTTAVRRWNCLGATPPRRGTAAAGQLYCRDAWCADMQWPVLMLIHTHTHVDTHAHTCWYTRTHMLIHTNINTQKLRVHIHMCVFVLQLPLEMLQPQNIPNPETAFLSTNSNWTKPSICTVQIQIEPISRLESVPQDTKEFEFLDLANFGDVTCCHTNARACAHAHTHPSIHEYTDTFSNTHIHKRTATIPSEGWHNSIQISDIMHGMACI